MRAEREIEELKAQLADRDAKIEKLAGELSLLQDLVKRLLKGRRGGCLEQEGQGLLFGAASATPAEDAAESGDGDDEDSDDEPDPPQPPATDKEKKRSRRKIDTTGLPREQRTHELPEEERVCPETGLTLVPVGEKVFEEIDYKRAQLTVIEHHQVIYGLSPEEAEERQATPVTAPMPPRPLEDCMASAVLLAWLLVQKFANHLPLYRQERIFARDGLRLPRQTLCDWTLRSAEALQPIADYLMSRVRAGPVMQLDDTPVMCQGGRGEKHFKACLWTFVNPEVDGVVYRFTSGRTASELAFIIEGFKGTLVGDGYQGNRAAANRVDDSIQHGGCWAHVTRKFRDAATEAPGTADLFRDDIKLLYEIEQKADEEDLDASARQVLRYKKSRPIVIRSLLRARRLRDEYTDAGLIAGAIGCLSSQRRPLRRFLMDGRVPIDNNSCERSIRPIAIGRRNWMFLGSMRGGRAAAVIFTLIESCRIADIDPIDYLADVLVRVASHPASRIDELLPANWSTTVAANQSAQPALV